MEKQHRNQASLKQELVFLAVHLVPIAAFWTTVTWFDWTVCGALYFIRMFFITGAYHRYFSHRTYKTSRWFQFFLAFMAQTSLQKGALWWAAHHREHHRHSDTPEDPHSMKLYGFWYSHIGWIAGPDYKETRIGLIQDFARFKELVWLNKYHYVPGVVMGTLVTMLGGIVNGNGIQDMFSHGLSTLFVGFFLSTVILYNGTFLINSLMHYIGSQRYKTGDESRNSLILALVTLGEGWHNNHHYYPSATRNGFFWWEIDITYYVLKTFSWLGLIWDLNPVPHHVKYPDDSARATPAKKKNVTELQKDNVTI